MSYNTILIYLTNAEQVPRLMSVARLIAQKDTHVIGCHVVRSVQVYPGISYPAESNIFSNLAKTYADNADACRRDFLAETENDEFVVEWRQSEADRRSSEDVATEQARIADLIICAQPDFGAGFYPTIVAEQFILESGRPVLLVPASAPINTLGKRPLVAWNGSKEACRAIFDAIPLLQGADLTTLLELESQDKQGLKSRLAAADMRATLNRHGIQCEMSRASVDGAAVGEEILLQTANRKGDLLVMGGYGHSRLREFVLGGATRHILRHMSIPVMMSH